MLLKAMEEDDRTAAAAVRLHGVAEAERRRVSRAPSVAGGESVSEEELDVVEACEAAALRVIRAELVSRRVHRMVAHPDVVAGSDVVDLLLREGAAATRDDAVARGGQMLARGFLIPSLPPPRAADGSEDALLLDATPAPGGGGGGAPPPAFEDGYALYAVDPAPRCVRALRPPGAPASLRGERARAAGGGMRVSPEELVVRSRAPICIPLCAPHADMHATMRAPWASRIPECRPRTGAGARRIAGRRRGGAAGARHAFPFAGVCISECARLSICISVSGRVHMHSRMRARVGMRVCGLAHVPECAPRRRRTSRARADARSWSALGRPHGAGGHHRAAAAAGSHHRAAAAAPRWRARSRGAPRACRASHRWAQRCSTSCEAGSPTPTPPPPPHPRACVTAARAFVWPVRSAVVVHDAGVVSQLCACRGDFECRLMHPQGRGLCCSPKLMHSVILEFCTVVDTFTW